MSKSILETGAASTLGQALKLEDSVLFRQLRRFVLPFLLSLLDANNSKKRLTPVVSYWLGLLASVQLIAP